MLYFPKIGQRVRCVSLSPYYSLSERLLNKSGSVMGMMQNDATSIVVQFDGEPHTWFCRPSHLEPIEPLTPEEREMWRQEEERRLDQERRQTYADKYL